MNNYVLVSIAVLAGLVLYQFVSRFFGTKPKRHPIEMERQAKYTSDLLQLETEVRDAKLRYDNSRRNALSADSGAD